MDKWLRTEGWLLAVGIRVDALWWRGVMVRARPALPICLPRYLPGARLAPAPIDPLRAPWIPSLDLFS